MVFLMNILKLNKLFSRKTVFGRVNINSIYFPSYGDFDPKEYTLHGDPHDHNALLGNTIVKEVEDVVIEYSVGPYRILITSSDGEYLYLADLVPRPSKDLVSIIDNLSRDLFRYAPEDRDLDDYYIAEVLRNVYRIPDDYVNMATYLVKERLKYGRIQVLLDDPYIEDISISGPGAVWVRHRIVAEKDPEADMIRTNIVLEAREVLSLQKYIATRSRTYISRSNPVVDVQLPREDGGHRVHLVDPTIAGNRPEITIRKKLEEKISVEWLIEKGSIKSEVAEYLRQIILSRGSIVIAGPPSSGKTTLLRALLNSYVPPSWKVVIIEDTPEIEIPENSSWVRYTTYELGAFHMDQFFLAKAALRSSANRLIVIGETRGAEAQVLAQALNMGMGALTTFHGGSSEEVITRLMSPPINMSKHQIGSIWTIVIMGVGCVNSKGVGRCVERVDEILVDNEIDIHTIYSVEDNTPGIIERSIRLKRASRARNPGNILVKTS